MATVGVRGLISYKSHSITLSSRHQPHRWQWKSKHCHTQTLGWLSYYSCTGLPGLWTGLRWNPHIWCILYRHMQVFISDMTNLQTVQRLHLVRYAKW